MARPAAKLPVKHRKRLTPKQIAFVKAKVENPQLPNYKVAMIATGTTDPNLASVQAVRLLRNDSVKDALEEALSEIGFTVKASAQVLMDALQANQTATFKGQIYESDKPDHGIRVNAARTILTLLGGGKPEGGGNSFTFNFNAPTATQEPQKSFIDGA